MQHNESVVIILKPKPTFLLFLAAQLPDIDLSNVSSLQTNHTAYTFTKRDSDEETLAEIERHFPTMFRHEITRVLGENACNQIEGTFLDFLCCFKFELHSQIIVMESSLEKGHQLLCIKPRTVLLKWMKSSFQDDQTNMISVFDSINLSHLVENATVLVKNFNHRSEVTPFIKHYYRPIFKAEMARMCCESEQWPAMDSLQLFRRYFAVEIHTHLIHLNAEHNHHQTLACDAQTIQC